METCIGLFYDDESGHFMDEDGYLVWCIFNYITPNDLLLFKANKEYMLVPNQSLPGTFCELFYPEEEDL